MVRCFVSSVLAISAAFEDASDVEQEIIEGIENGFLQKSPLFRILYAEPEANVQETESFWDGLFSPMAQFSTNPLRRLNEDHHGNGPKRYSSFDQGGCRAPTQRNITDLHACIEAANKEYLNLYSKEDNQPVPHFKEGDSNVLDLSSTRIEGPMCAILNDPNNTNNAQAHKLVFQKPNKFKQPLLGMICEVTSQHYTSVFGPLVFLLLVLGLSACTLYIEKFIKRWGIPLPHTVLLFALGALLGFLGTLDEDNSGNRGRFGAAMASFQSIDPHFIFWVLLPPLLFEDASGTNWHVFKRIFPNAFLLAFPGVIVNTLLTAVIVRYTFQGNIPDGELVIPDTGPDSLWQWPQVLLLSCILSATDPVAVIGALNSLGAPAKLSTLIAGEALMNDGSAVVLFKIFVEWAGQNPGTPFNVGRAFILFARLALGAVGLGLSLSFLLHWCLKITREHFNVQLILILGFTYAAFFISDQHEVNVSAVLCVVIVGYYMSAAGNYLIDPHRFHDYHAILSFLSLLANEAIFILAGLVVHRYSVEDDNLFHALDVRNLLEILMLFVIIHVTRAVTLLLFWPMMRKMGYGLTFKELIICLMGALRGAVGLALALLVDSDTSSHRLPNYVQSRIAYLVSAITILTIVLNGSTISIIYNRLNIYPKPKAHTSLLKRALLRIESLATLRLRNLEYNWFFHNSFLDLMREASPRLGNTVNDVVTPNMSVTDFVTETMIRAKEGINCDCAPVRYASKLKKKGGNSNPFLVGSNSMMDDYVQDIISQTICLTLKQSDRARRTQLLEDRNEEKDGQHRRRTRATHEEVNPEAISVDDIARRRPEPNFRPGRTAHNVCVASLASVNYNVDLSRSGSRGRMPKFGINGNNDECELRNGFFFCGRDRYKNTSSQSSIPKDKSVGTKDDKCHPAEGLQCAHCIEFSEDLVKKKLGWGPMTLSESQRIVARKLWKHVKKNIRKVIRVKIAINKDTSAFAQQANFFHNSEIEIEPFKDLDELRSDVVTMAEVYMTILNAIHDRVNQMHEFGTLPTESYLLFVDAMENGIDAVNGELGNEKFLCGTYLEGLHDQPRIDQMKASIHVVWRSMVHSRIDMNRVETMLHDSCGKFMNRLLMNKRWTSILRNTELALSFIFIADAFMKEEGTNELVKDFPLIKRSLKSGIALAKAEFLYKIQESEPGIFIAVEHILALRTVIQEKKHLLHHIAQMGMISNEECHKITHYSLDPLLKTLSTYTPTWEQVSIAESFHKNRHTEKKMYKDFLQEVTEKHKPALSPRGSIKLTEDFAGYRTKRQLISRFLTSLDLSEVAKKDGGEQGRLGLMTRGGTL